MLRSFLLIALRLFKSRKLYSIITVGGLSLSIAIAGLVYLFLKYEMSFDQMHQNKDRIYRMESNIYFPSNSGESILRIPQLPAPLIDEIRSKIPSIVRSTRIGNSLNSAVVSYEGKIFSEKITYVDDDFFKMFSFQSFTDKDINAFKDVSSVVISESAAKKYFGTTDPVGKILSINGDGSHLYTVQAILHDAPENSSIEFDFLVPTTSWQYYNDYSTLMNEYTYSFFFEISESANEDDLKRTLTDLVNISMKEQIESLRKSFSLSSDVKPYEMSITKLNEVHWNVKMPWNRTSDPRNFKILIGIAMIILFIASVNFVSMSLVTSTRRGVEVGIRKIFGGSSRQIANYFNLESILYCFASASIGVILMFLALPLFNSLINKNISFTFDLLDGFYFLLVVVLLGLLAGSYPSILLASFNPAVVLKSKAVYNVKTMLISVLVIIQFSLSLFLGNCSFVMNREMNYINSKDLGFNRDQIIVLKVPREDEQAVNSINRFKDLAERETSILGVSASSQSLFSGISRMGYVDREGNRKSVISYSVDYDFIKVLGLQVLQGRSFDPKNTTDVDAIIINETLAKEISEKPLDNSFQWGMNNNSNIIGIVKDFHYRSFEHPIQPLLLNIKAASGVPSALLIKTKNGNLEEAVSRIGKIWKKVNPNSPFEYSFLDTDIAEQYSSYQRWTSIMNWANVFAALIACIGLFGLTGINISNRYHEIGIRKVIGASFWDILILINRQYFLLAIVSMVIGVTASYFVMLKWIKTFAYTISIGFEFIFYGFLFGFAITLVAIAYHSIRAAWSNPADTIRYE